MSDPDTILYEAELRGAAEAESELGRLIRESDEAAEQIEKLGGAAAAAAAMSVTEWDALQDRILRAHETLQAYSQLMERTMLRSGGNETGLSTLARHIVNVPQAGALHAYQPPNGAPNPHANPTLFTQEDAPRQVNPFELSGYRKVPVDAPMKIITSMTRINDAGGQTARETEHGARIATNRAFAADRKAFLMEARGDDNDTAPEYRMAAAGHRHEAEFLTALGQAKRAFEEFTAEANLAAAMVGKMGRSVHDINELGRQEEEFTALGDHKQAGKIRNRRDQLVYGMRDTLDEAQAWRAGADPDAVPAGFDRRIKDFGRRYDFERGDIVARRGEEGEQAAAEKGRADGAKRAERVLGDGKGLLGKIGGLQEEIEFAENKGDLDTARQLRGQLRNIVTKKIAPWQREVKALRSEVDGDLIPDDLGGVSRQLAGKRQGFTTRYGAEQRAEEALRSQAAYDKYVAGEKRQQDRDDKTYWSAVGMNERFDQKRQNGERRAREGDLKDAFREADKEDKTYWSAFGANERFDGKRARETQRQQRADARDYEKFWQQAMRDQDKREDFGAHVEGALSKGERRTVDIGEGGSGKHFDFGNLKADIAEALKQGLIDQKTATDYQGRIKGVEGLQGAASAAGAGARLSAEREELLGRAKHAAQRAEIFEKLGDKGQADAYRREALRANRDVIAGMTRIEEIFRQMKTEGLHQGADDFKKRSQAQSVRGVEGYEDMRGRLNQDEGRLNTGGLGGWLRGELHRVPGGRYASALFGDHMAHAVNGGAGRMFENLAGSAAGQAMGRTTMGKAALEAGKRAVGSAVTVAGGAEALTAVAMNPVTIGVAVAGVAGFLANKYANKAYEQGSGARQEEMQGGDIARRIGSRSRILDDVRQADGHGGSGAILGQYAQLGYSSGDVLNYVGASNASGLNDATRRGATLTGLRIARARGLETGEMADVQGEMKRGMLLQDANGGRLEADLNRFSLILSEAVKRGVGGPEMAQAFKGALGSATQLAGGKMFEAQSEAFMAQMLGLQRTKDPYLSGANGVNTITSMNNTLGGIEGADRLFFYRAIQNKSARDLGYEGQQGERVQAMLDENPMLATGYILKNGTKKSRELIAGDIYKSANGDMTTAQSMFQDSGMSENQASWAAVDYAQQYKKYGGDTSKIRLDVWDSWTGRNGDGTAAQDAASFADPQSGNVNEGIARRQEQNYGEIKMRASHVSFDSVTGQIAIQSVQSIALGGVSAKKAIQAESDGHAIGNSWRGAHPNDGTTRGFETDKGTRGFSTGGYTGNGGVGDVAGVVHGQEFVVNAAATSGNREMLEYLNRGGRLPGFQRGGAVGNVPYRATGDGQLVSALQDLTLTLRELCGGSSRSDLAGVSAGAQGGGLMTMIKGGLSGAWNTVRNFLTGGSGEEGGAEGGAATVSAGGGTSTRVKNPVIAKVPVADPATWGADPKGTAVAAQALKALTDSSFVDILGRCSMFARQVNERALGMSDYSLSGKLFADEARQSGLLWQKAGLTQTLAGAKAHGGLRPGDTIFQMSGSGDYDGDGDDGHVGIIGPDGKSVIENSTRGGRGKQVTPLDKWGKIDLVGRLGGWGQTASAAQGRAQAAATATSVNHGGTIKVEVTTDGKRDAPLTNATNRAIAERISSRVVAPNPTRMRARAGH